MSDPENATATATTTSTTPPPSARPPRSAGRVLAAIAVHALFWPWNLLFIAIVAFGYVPLALLDLVIDAADGLAPWSFVLLSVALVALPIAITVEAIRSLRRSTSKLALVFFGFELPLIVFLCARLFGLGELSAGAELLLACLLVGGAAATVRVLFPARLARSPLATRIAHAAIAVLCAAGLYVGALVSTFSLPALAAGIAGVARGMVDAATHFNGGTVMAALFLFVPMVWGGLTFVVVLVLPAAAPFVWLRLLVGSGRSVAGTSSTRTAVIGALVPAAGAAIAFALLWRQPFERVAPLLDEAPTSADARAALLDDRAAVRAGLVDAHLALHRYFSISGAPGATPDLDDDTSYYRTESVWDEVWRPIVGAPAARVISRVGMTAARPFVFQGSNVDVGDAAARYRMFFGTDLERDNAEAIRDALKSSWSRQQRYAGFVDEGERRVRLVRQDVATTDQGDGVVEVEIHDEWVNMTTQDAEAVLYFELPQSAAVTGLWLSPDDDKAHGAAFVVAPRGAAQQVYKEQVQRRRDPALLEQIGPRQYRLKVFPVPARHVDRDRGRLLPFAQSPDGWWNTAEHPRQHVWLRYQALVDADGHAPLPRLAERRNAFWDERTLRVFAGEAVRARDCDDDDDDAAGAAWVQPEGAAERTAPSVVQVSTTIAGGACFALTSRAMAAAPMKLDGKHVDVVIDTSLAMEAERARLAAALTALRASGATLRTIVATTALAGGAPRVVGDVSTVDPMQLPLFGAASVKDLLSQYAGLPRDAAADAGADALVVLTWRTNLDLATDAPLPDGLELPPTVLVHLGGRFPAGYDDASIDAVRRSGGTAVGTIEAALERLGGNVVVDDRALTSCAPAGDRHPALAARLAILARERQLAGGAPTVADLDVLHGLAKGAGVVTPYSSMIVLVDDAQRQRLAQLEKQEDRFQREVDEGTKSAPEVMGVPEPGEWVLIGLCAAVLVVIARRRRDDQSLRAC